MAERAAMVMGRFHLAVALWAGVCGSVAAQAPASAGTSGSALLDPTVRLEYAAMRHAFLVTLEEDGIDGVLEHGASGACLEPTMFMAPPDQVKEAALSWLALDAATIESMIVRGAGGEGWADTLAAFEARMLAERERGVGAFEESYPSERGLFAQSLAPPEGLPDMEDTGAMVLDCMMGGTGHAALDGMVASAIRQPGWALAGHPSRRGILVSLLSDPDGASIRMISRWNRLVCEGKRIDVLDFEACAGWTELAAGSLADVLGDYHYHATWPDGSTRSGQISFNRSVETSRVVFGKSGPLVR